MIIEVINFHDCLLIITISLFISIIITIFIAILMILIYHKRKVTIFLIKNDRVSLDDSSEGDGDWNYYSNHIY